MERPAGSSAWAKSPRLVHEDYFALVRADRRLALSLQGYEMHSCYVMIGLKEGASRRDPSCRWTVD